MSKFFGKKTDKKPKPKADNTPFGGGRESETSGRATESSF